MVQQTEADDVTRLRRLDHVAILVRDTDQAVLAFSGRLGLAVVHEDVLVDPPVRLTYLDVGNAYLQLVEPLEGSSDLARQLQVQGEGLHHVCFGVDDVPAAVAALSAPDSPPPLAHGRGRPSGFVGNGLVHGVRLECTEFRHEADVACAPGWVA